MTDAYRAVMFEQAGRGIDEMAENLRQQIADEAASIAEAARHPLTAGYLSGRTSRLHDWATHLSALRSVKDGWFRQSDTLASPTQASSREEEDA